MNEVDSATVEVRLRDGRLWRFELEDRVHGLILDAKVDAEEYEGPFAEVARSRVPAYYSHARISLSGRVKEITHTAAAGAASEGSTPDPRALCESLVGHRVKVKTVTGRRLKGIMLGCGPSGFQITSGIGGRLVFGYGDVDEIKDLGVAE